MDNEQTPHLRRNTDKPIEPDVSLMSGEQPLDTAVLDNETANAAQQGSTGKNVAKATAGIMPLYLLRFAIGFVANPLIGRSTGLAWQADAYAVATDMVQRIWLLFEKVLNPAFLPCFIAALKEEGEDRAWKLASTAIWITALALVVMTALFWNFMPNIVDIYTPRLTGGATPQQLHERQLGHALTIEYGRLLLSGLFFLGMSSLTYTILNGYKRFVMAALGDTLWKFGIFGGALWVLLLNRNLPVADHLPPEQALRIISWGYIGGAFLKLAPHIIAIGSKWKFLRPQIDFKDPLLRKVALLAIPLILGIVVSEIRGVYLQRLAADPSILLIHKIEAGRAALKFSRTIGDSLIQIFPYALSIGIFPYLADLAREKDKQPLTNQLIGALRVCIFGFAPVTAILIALRLPLLSAVWEGGRMTGDDVEAMSGPFIGFTIGLMAFSCEMILNQTFYAMTKAWTPTIMGLVATVVWVIFAKLGVQSFGWGLLAIAGAESLAKTIKCLLMWTWIRPHLGRVDTKRISVFLAKVAVASVLAAVAAGFIGTKISNKVVRSKLGPTAATTDNGQAGGLFVRDDLQSTSDMLSKLRDGKDGLSKYLFSQTSPTFQQQLKSTTGHDSFEEPLKESLIVELNRLIQKPNLYNKERFAETHVQQETLKLIETKPQGQELVHLNRQLLEESYSDELVKRPGKFKMLMAVFISGVISMLIFFGLAALLKIEEMTAVGAASRKIKSKLARRKN